MLSFSYGFLFLLTSIDTDYTFYNCWKIGKSSQSHCSLFSFCCIFCHILSSFLSWHRNHNPVISFYYWQKMCRFTFLNLLIQMGSFISFSHSQNMGDSKLIQQSIVIPVTFSTKLWWKSNLSDRFCQNTFYRWDPNSVFLGISFREISDSLWSVNAIMQAMVQTFSEWGKVDRVHSLRETKDCHQSINT